MKKRKKSLPKSHHDLTLFTKNEQILTYIIIDATAKLLSEIFFNKGIIHTCKGSTTAHRLPKRFMSTTFLYLLTLERNTKILGLMSEW